MMLSLGGGGDMDRSENVLAKTNPFLSNGEEEEEEDDDGGRVSGSNPTNNGGVQKWKLSFGCMFLRAWLSRRACRQRFPHRSSVGSFLRVRCWLGKLLMQTERREREKERSVIIKFVFLCSSAGAPRLRPRPRPPRPPRRPDPTAFPPPGRPPWAAAPLST